MLARHAGERTEQPFGIIGRGKPAMAIQQVTNTKAHDLDRGFGRNEDEQLLLKAMRVFAPFAVACAVPDLAGGFAAGRSRGHAPDRRRFLIAQIEDFCWSVGYGIVRPWRDPVFAAVDSPAEAASRFGDEAAEIVVGKNVGPGRWCRLSCFEMNYIFAPVRRETANAVVEQQIGRAFRSRKRGRPAQESRERIAVAGWPASWPFRSVRKAYLVILVECDCGDRFEQVDLVRADLIGEQQMDATASAKHLDCAEVAQGLNDFFAQWLDIG